MARGGLVGIKEGREGLQRRADKPGKVGRESTRGDRASGHQGIGVIGYCGNRGRIGTVRGKRGQKGTVSGERRQKGKVRG